MARAAKRKKRKTTKRKTKKRKTAHRAQRFSGRKKRKTTKRKTTRKKKTKRKRSTAMAAKGKGKGLTKPRRKSKPALLAGFPKMNKTTGMQILKTGAAVVIGRVIVSNGSVPDLPYLSEESIPWIVAALLAGSATEKRIYWTIALTMSALEIAEEKGWLEKIGVEAI